MQALDNKKPKDCLKFFLYGDVGAGKTYFVKRLLATMGYDKIVSSPTFSIVNNHSFDFYFEKPLPDLKEESINLCISHIDLYRLNSEEDLYSIAIYDIINSSDIIFIEWPELLVKALKLNKKDGVFINFFDKEHLPVIEQ